MQINNSQLQAVIQQTSPLSATQSTTTPPTSSESSPLENSVRETLGIDGNNAEIDEEQLQHGLTHHILDELYPGSGEAYDTAFSEAQAGGASVEDAVKAALQTLVDQQQLPAEEAEKINGITFRAAQLDDNLDALYDGRGGPNDPTVAKAAIGDAIAKAQETLTQLQDGTIQDSARALDAASNIAPSSSTSTIQGSHRTGSGGGFLWKPQSESNGKLVVLLPSEYTGKVASAKMHSSLPPSSSNLIEEGKFSGDNHNGGRAHFRFNRAGGDYPDGVYVVAQLTDGRTVSFPVGESSARGS